MTTPTEDEARGLIRNAVMTVVTNASNFPAKVTPHILGQNMGPLGDRITDAVLAISRVSTPPTDEDERDEIATIIDEELSDLATRVGKGRILDLAALIAARVRRQAVSTPEPAWEYATVSEVTSAQVINTAHVDYWRSRGFRIIRRRKASEWEPVPTEGEA